MRIADQCIALMCFSVALLTGCNQPTESNTASEARASATEVSLVEDGTSRTLTRVEGTPIHNLDGIQNVKLPYSEKSISISSASDTALTGWAIDGRAKKEAGGVDIVLDRKIYRADYGSDRPDVTDYLKFPATKSGFSLVIPRNALSRGTHTVSVRVITNDGKSYAEGPTVEFVVE